MTEPRYRCGNCGGVAREGMWIDASEPFKPEGADRLDDAGPFVCPRCGFHHYDDDADPGIEQVVDLRFA